MESLDGVEVSSEGGKYVATVSVERVPPTLFAPRRGEAPSPLASPVSASRIGAFEVSALLFEGERLVAQECIFSKLLSGRWPKVERVVARSHEFVQDALRREQEALKQAWRQLTDYVEEGSMLHDCAAGGAAPRLDGQPAPAHRARGGGLRATR